MRFDTKIVFDGQASQYNDLIQSTTLHKLSEKTKQPMTESYANNRLLLGEIWYDVSPFLTNEQATPNSKPE